VRRSNAAAAVLLAGMLGAPLLAQETISFQTQDGGRVFADAYGAGVDAVVLAHGGRFDKESWSEQARALAKAGYRVLALDFRGHGKSRGPGQAEPMSAPLQNDVLAAVRYLRREGAAKVSVVGASMGGFAAGNAAAAAKPGEIDALVLLGARAGRDPGKIGCPKLFIASRDDADGSGEKRLPGIQASYDASPEPKELLLFEGSAHAQFLFATPDGPKVLAAILRFLPKPERRPR
jgi:pimeloyl-ACP methyl ester carboxylesterase